MNIHIRPLTPYEIPLLEELLYQAVYQRDPANPIPRSVVQYPEVRVYIQDYGRKDDHCLVAVSGGQIVGGVWTRILCGEIKGFGNIDPHTPEFAISVLGKYRGRGIGRQLMLGMLALLREKGYAQASLAVQKDNPAVRLYRSVGFATVRETDEEYIMVNIL